MVIDNFEQGDLTGWMLYTDISHANQWVVGPLTSSGGTKAAYVSGDNGASLRYSPDGENVSLMAKQLPLSDGKYYRIYYRWKAQGDATHAFLSSCLTGHNPSFSYVNNGTALPTAYSEIVYNTISGSGTWQTDSFDILGSKAASDLVFLWYNDTQWHKNYVQHYDTIQLDSVTIQIDSFMVWNVDTVPFALFNTLMTSNAPAGCVDDVTYRELPIESYHCGFESVAERRGWNFKSFGTNGNKWVMGNGGGGSGNALFIAKDGESNPGYDGTAQSVSVAYIDLLLEAGAIYQLNFDWLVNTTDASSGLSVIVYPSSDHILFNAQGNIVNGVGERLKLTARSATLTASSIELIGTGVPQCVAFVWRNDGTSGASNSVSAMLDNVSLQRLANPMAFYDFNSDATSTGWSVASSSSGCAWHRGDDYILNRAGTMYVSADNGTTAGYNQATEAATVTYLPVTLTSGTVYTISFDYYVGGERKRDEMFVGMMTSLPPAGANYSQLVEWFEPFKAQRYNNVSGWQKGQIKVKGTGQPAYLGFFWQNDSNGLGSNPGGCIDNVMIRQSSLTNDCNFESSNPLDGWSFNHKGSANEWVIGSAVQNGGNNALYVSPDFGKSATYSKSGGSFILAYKEVLLNEGEEVFAVFDWMSHGNANSDYMSVCLVDDVSDLDAYDPMNSVVPSWYGLSLAGTYSGSSSWQTDSVRMIGTGKLQAIAFVWVNTNVGGANSPGGCIDNIRFIPFDGSHYVNKLESPADLSDWTLINEPLGNAWVAGNALSATGNKCLYVSADEGLTAGYVNGATPTVITAYTTVTLPKGVLHEVSFAWLANGIPGRDYLSVCVVDSEYYSMDSTTAGVLPPWYAKSLVKSIAGQRSFGNRESFQVIGTGKPMHIAFVWQNVAGGVASTPGGAIDDLTIVPIDITQYKGDFENAAEHFGWTIRGNGSNENNWTVGNAIASTGNRSLYMAKDANGTYGYDGNYLSTSIAYQSFFLEAGKRYVIAFDWQKGMVHASSDLMLCAVGNEVQIDSVFDGSLPNWAHRMFSTSSLNWVRDSYYIDGQGAIVQLAFVWNTSSTSSQIYTGAGAIDNMTIHVEESNDSIYTFEPASHALAWHVLSDGTGSNVWTVGSAVAKSGNNSLYVTTNGGTTAGYNNSVESFTIAYHPVTFALDSFYKVSFDWMANGEMGSDELLFCVLDSIPTALTADSLGRTLFDGDKLMSIQGVTNWQYAEVLVEGTGAPAYLAFVWKNDGNGVGANNAGCVDNIAFAPIAIPDRRSWGFENLSEQFDWNFINDNVNRWVIGSAAKRTGDKSLYVTNNGGTTATYTKSRNSAIATYTTVILKPGVEYSVTFDARVRGEAGVDELSVCWMDDYTDNITLSAGSAPGAWYTKSHVKTIASASVWQNHSFKVTGTGNAQQIGRAHV